MSILYVATCKIERRFLQSAGRSQTFATVGVAGRGIDREFEFYEFFSFLKFNEFYEFFFRLKKIRKKFVILQIIDV